MRITRRRWWLFKCTRAEIDAALAATCRMALAQLIVNPAGYEVRTATQCLLLSLAPRRAAFELGFDGAWREGKKGRLIQNLIAKQFDPVIPRLRIRLSRTR